MLIRDIPYIMIRCLLLTIIIEVLFFLLLKGRNKKDIINVILVNIITNPIVVIIPIYLNLRYGIIYRNISLIILEISIVLIEGFCYKKSLKYNKINPYLLALILNILSYSIGEIINYLRW